VKTILFVDDEARILSGLQRALRPQRSVWNMLFANSGDEALAMLAGTPTDVVVSDFRMPGMDGAELLRQVRRRHPAVVRIILSGQFDNEAGLRALPETHQFLSKPCEPSMLSDHVSRVCRLADQVESAPARAVAAGLSSLPLDPEAYRQLADSASREDSDLVTLTDLAVGDLAVTVKALQLAHSAYFGVTQKAHSVPEAIGSLGFNLLRQLVLATDVFEASVAEEPLAVAPAELHCHSMTVAELARGVFAPPELAFAATVAALLHDTGKMVLAHRFPQEYRRALAAVERHGVALSQAEKTELGAAHEDVGGYLAGIWGFPETSVQAILKHHAAAETEPAFDVNGRCADLNWVLALANHFAGDPDPALEARIPPALWSRWSASAAGLKAA
jgi:HD-like signal output (HDOD) protein